MGALSFVTWIRSEKKRELFEFETYKKAFQFQKDMQGTARRLLLSGRRDVKVVTKIAPIVWGVDSIRFILSCEKVDVNQTRTV